MTRHYTNRDEIARESELNMKPKIEPIFSYLDFSSKPCTLSQASHQSQYFADIANAKIEKLLGPKVWGYKLRDGEFTFHEWSNVVDATHTAHLFNIQPLETRPACEGGEHEPDEDGPSSWDNSKMVCLHCKKKISKTVNWSLDE
jgi:hypothetical protein